MENNKLFVLGGSIFALACLPFLILSFSGGANAGLSHGFQTMFGPNLGLVLTFCVGAGSLWVGRDGPIILPLTFLLLFAVASLLNLDTLHYAFTPWFILGSILIYAVALTLVDSRRFVVAIALSSSIAFQLGLRNDATAYPDIDPLYNLLGQFLALSLILATSVCFTLAVGEWLLARILRFFPEDRGWFMALRSWFL